MKSYDVAVIGAGPGGYVAAIRAAQLGLKTVCIEKRKELGGTCLNVGCIPSKALLHSSEQLWKMEKEASHLGISCGKIHADFPKMLERKEKIITGFNQGIEALFKKNKIEWITGAASFESATTLRVGDELITANSFIIATGSEPISLPFLPLDEHQIVSSTGALSLPKVPPRMLVVGAGVIGVELGSVYSRLGSEVTFVEFMDRACPTFDLSLSKELLKELTAQGMKFHLSTKVIGAEKKGKTVSLSIESGEGKSTLEAEVVLVAIGRRPYTEGLGLEKIGVALDSKGRVAVDGRFRTAVPSIYAIGDLVDGPMLAHKASEEGSAVAEIIAGQTPHIEYIAIPSVVYTYPEVASVGLSETQAKELGFTLSIGNFHMGANSRAKCTGESIGFVKLIADKRTDQLLGIHIIAPHASELIASCALALERKLTAKQLGSVPFAHPTLSEAIKEAALDSAKRAIHR